MIYVTRAGTTSEPTRVYFVILIYVQIALQQGFLSMFMTSVKIIRATATNFVAVYVTKCVVVSPFDVSTRAPVTQSRSVSVLSAVFCVSTSTKNINGLGREPWVSWGCGKP